MWRCSCRALPANGAGELPQLLRAVDGARFGQLWLYGHRYALAESVGGCLDAHTHVQASGDAEALSRFTAQAMRDWNALLELRSKELQVGGRLLTVNLSRDEAGLYLGHNGGRTRNVHDQLHQIWREMADEGRISADHYRAATVMNFYKSPDEFMAPLKDTTSAAYRNGLRLIDQRTVYVECPYRRRWKENGDTTSFASGLMATIRSWSRHSFASTAGDAAADELYGRLEKRIAAAPDEWSSITSSTIK